jgi:hypothetical protein
MTDTFQFPLQPRSAMVRIIQALSVLYFAAPIMAVRPTKMASATEQEGAESAPTRSPVRVSAEEVARLAAELKEKKAALKIDLDKDVQEAQQNLEKAQTTLDRVKKEKKKKAAAEQTVDQTVDSDSSDASEELSPVYYRTRGQAKNYHNIVTKDLPEPKRIVGNVRSAIAKTTNYGKELLKLQDKIDHVASAIQTFEKSVQRNHRGQYKNMLVHLEDDALRQVTQLKKDSRAIKHYSHNELWDATDSELLPGADAEVEGDAKQHTAEAEQTAALEDGANGKAAAVGRVDGVKADNREDMGTENDRTDGANVRASDDEGSNDEEKPPSVKSALLELMRSDELPEEQRRAPETAMAAPLGEMLNVPEADIAVDHASQEGDDLNSAGDEGLSGYGDV